MTAISALPGYVVGTWDIDPTHSEVGFSVRHMMVSKVRGRFGDFTGQIVTGETPEQSSVTASIDTTSITTGNADRDAHVRSGDFFGVDEHPSITFASSSVAAKGDDWILTGELTIKNTTKTVELKLESNGFGPDAYGGTRAGFTATTEINRQDYGVNWSAAMETGGVVVSDKVSIQLEIEAVLKTA